MKLVRIGTILLHEISCFGARNGFNSNFYFTKAMPSRRCSRPSECSKELYSRISPVGDPNISIVPILDQWVEEGRSVDKESLIDIMKKLLLFKRFSHSLEISSWMIDKRHFELTPSDAATRLKLISETKGVDEAEIFFNSLSEKLRTLPVYGALLNCYASAHCVEKAEELMQKMRIMNSSHGISNHVWDYNVMLNLYRKTGNMEKFNALLQEMEKNGVVRTNATLGIQLSAYADVKDIEGMDKIVRILECDPDVVWTNFSVAATGYIKAGFFDKALEMLKKVEAHVKGHEYQVYNYLLAQYGAIGRKDEVLRVWSLYKQKCEASNAGYKCVLDSLAKLGDIEMAEEIFREWEFQGLSYDIHIPTIMIGAYSKRGLIGKAEALLDKAISKGGKPCAWTWHYLVEGYILTEQYQKAVETMEKVFAHSGTGLNPVPTVASIKACLKYLDGVGDTVEAEEFAQLLLYNDAISLDQLNKLLYDIGFRMRLCRINCDC